MAKILAFKNRIFRDHLQNVQYNKQLRDWAKERIAEREKQKESGNDEKRTDSEG